MISKINTHGTYKKYGGGNMKAWGCFARCWVALVRKTEVIMDKVQYKTILEYTYNYFLLWRSCVYHGSVNTITPKHMTNNVKCFFREQYVSVRYWLANNANAVKIRYQIKLTHTNENFMKLASKHGWEYMKGN